MKTNTIRFPGAYHALVRTLRVDFKPSHFFDLIVLGIVGLAFFASVLSMGGVSQNSAVITPRLVAVAFLLHVFSQVIRSAQGVRVRWTGALLAPFALWLFVDGTFLSPCAWRGREQAAVALTAAMAFWIVSHHLRHRAHRWCLVAGMAFVASIFGALVIGGGANILPRLAQRVVAKVYSGHETGPFATPGELGAFLLLTVLPAAAVCFAPALRHRRRVAAGLATLLGVCGLWMTHHVASFYGLAVGASLLCLLLIERKRVACVASAAIAGATFLIPAFATLDSGLFRVDDKRAPLAEAAWKIFTANPVKGAGSGTFPAVFESVRPAGWDLDPLTAGGFFHQLAAENGLVGLLLLAPAAILVWVLLFRKTWSSPVRLVRYNPQFKKKNLYTPDDRIAGAGLLAGSAAAAVSLTFDYAAPSVTLALGFAIVGAIATRAVTGEFAATTASPAPNPSFTLRALPGAAVFAAFAFAVLPAFESAGYARRAADTLSAAVENPLGNEERRDDQGQMRMLVRGFRATAIVDAEKSARLALRTAPDNARAEAVLADVIAERIRTSGDTRGAADCLTAALGAAAHSGGEIALNLPLVTALRLNGRETEASGHLDRLRASAPENAPVAVEEARLLLARGDAPRAAVLLDAILRKEPWNKEARRLRKIAGINASASGK